MSNNENPGLILILVMLILSTILSFSYNAIQYRAKLRECDYDQTIREIKVKHFYYSVENDTLKNFYLVENALNPDGRNCDYSVTCDNTTYCFSTKEGYLQFNDINEYYVCTAIEKLPHEKK